MRGEEGPGHVRHLVRLTWGQEDRLALAGAALVFLLGDFLGGEVQARVDREAAMFGDILQGEYEETYHQLALKSMSGLHWATHLCPKADWLVKTDDDMVLDMAKVSRVLEDMERDQDREVIACQAKTNDLVVRPGKGPEKWMVSVEEFKDSTYPTYCFGAFYAMSSDVGSRLLKSFQDRGEKFFKIDDVFVTGILASEARVGHK